MRPLIPLAAFLIWAAPCARAQTRTGAVETGGAYSPSGALNTTLSPAFVPQLVTLNLTAPALTLTPVLTPNAPALKTLPAAYAPGIVTRNAPVVATVPSGFVPPAALELKSGGAGAKTGLESAHEDLGGLKDGELIDLTKRMFDESIKPASSAMTRLKTDAGFGDSKFTAAYLRPDKPLPFGVQEALKYEDVLGYGASDPERAKAIVDAASALLGSAGVVHTRITRLTTEGKPEESLVITPEKSGGALNKLAWNIRERHGVSLEYSPAHLGYGAAAMFNHAENVLYLPHFGRKGTYVAVLHETHHSNYAMRQAKGDLSPFHARAVAHTGYTIIPRAAYYKNFASMEELTAYAKTIKQMLAAARRNPPTSWWDAYDIDVEADQLEDLARSAVYLAQRVRIELKDGRKPQRVPPGERLDQLGPIPGGAWYSLTLPWSEFYFPVMDEAPPAPKRGLAKLFGRKPLTPETKAALRTANALTAWTLEAFPLIASVRAKLAADKPDWKALDAIAGKLALLGPKAEAAFKQAP